MINGTFCQSSNQEVSLYYASLGHVLRCNIEEYPGMNICPKAFGSHGVTFFSYLAIRIASDWARKSSFALLDGASLRYVIEENHVSNYLRYLRVLNSEKCHFRLANEHHSDVSKVQITNQIGLIFASLIPAFVLEDAPEGSIGEDV